MVHSIVRWIRKVYPGVVFGAYLLAFLLAFTMVFMLPIGALGLVFIALMALIPVVAILGVVKAVERPLAIRKLRRGVCPACDVAAIVARDASVVRGEAGYACGSCGALFNSRGEDVDEDIEAEADLRPTAH
jgi:hypothetical protein